MTIKNNGIKFDKSEIDEITKMRERCTILSEYIDDMIDFYAVRGIDVELYKYPSNFVIDGPKGTGWYGPFSGKITNNKNSSELYGSSVLFDDYFGDIRMLKINTGSGGGGSKFSYTNNSCILVETMPRVSEEHLGDTERAKAQSVLNDELNALYKTYKLKIKVLQDNKIKHDDKLQELQKISDELSDMHTLIRDLLSCRKTNIMQSVVNENRLVLPKLHTSMLDFTEYTYLKLRYQTTIVNDDTHVINEHIDTFNAFVKRNAHLFI